MAAPPVAVHSADPPGLVLDCPTPAGVARLAVDLPEAPVAALLLGHGAGGGIDAADLLTVRDVALAAGVAAVRVVQPYRLAGRRAPDRAERLDDAWATVAQAVREAPETAALHRLPLVSAGRSSGARVACRTADRVAAAAVLALAFPLRPPGRAVTREAELLGVRRPALVVQGDRDAFGPAAEVRRLAGPDTPWLEVAEVAGADHAFRASRATGRRTADCLADVAAAVGGWLAGLGYPARRSAAAASEARTSEARTSET